MNDIYSGLVSELYEINYNEQEQAKKERRLRKVYTRLSQIFPTRGEGLGSAEGNKRYRLFQRMVRELFVNVVDSDPIMLGIVLSYDLNLPLFHREGYLHAFNINALDFDLPIKGFKDELDYNFKYEEFQREGKDPKVLLDDLKEVGLIESEIQVDEFDQLNGLLDAGNIEFRRKLIERLKEGHEDELYWPDSIDADRREHLAAQPQEMTPAEIRAIFRENFLKATPLVSKTIKDLLAIAFEKEGARALESRLNVDVRAIDMDEVNGYEVVNLLGFMDHVSNLFGDDENTLSKWQAASKELFIFVNDFHRSTGQPPLEFGIWDMKGAQMYNITPKEGAYIPRPSLEDSPESGSELINLLELFQINRYRGSKGYMDDRLKMDMFYKAEAAAQEGSPVDILQACLARHLLGQLTVFSNDPLVEKYPHLFTIGVEVKANSDQDGKPKIDMKLAKFNGNITDQMIQQENDPELSKLWKWRNLKSEEDMFDDYFRANGLTGLERDMNILMQSLDNVRKRIFMDMLADLTLVSQHYSIETLALLIKYDNREERISEILKHVSNDDWEDDEIKLLEYCFKINRDATKAVFESEDLVFIRAHEAIIENLHGLLETRSRGRIRMSSVNKAWEEYVRYAQMFNLDYSSALLKYPSFFGSHQAEKLLVELSDLLKLFYPICQGKPERMLEMSRLIEDPDIKRALFDYSLFQFMETHSFEDTMKVLYQNVDNNLLGYRSFEHLIEEVAQENHELEAVSDWAKSKYRSMDSNFAAGKAVGLDAYLSFAYETPRELLEAFLGTREDETPLASAIFRDWWIKSYANGAGPLGQLFRPIDYLDNEQLQDWITQGIDDDIKQTFWEDWKYRYVAVSQIMEYLYRQGAISRYILLRKILMMPHQGVLRNPQDVTELMGQFLDHHVQVSPSNQNAVRSIMAAFAQAATPKEMYFLMWPIMLPALLQRPSHQANPREVTQSYFQQYFSHLFAVDADNLDEVPRNLRTSLETAVAGMDEVTSGRTLREEEDEDDDFESMEEMSDIPYEDEDLDQDFAAEQDYNLGGDFEEEEDGEYEPDLDTPRDDFEDSHRAPKVDRAFTPHTFNPSHYFLERASYEGISHAGRLMAIKAASIAFSASVGSPMAEIEAEILRDIPDKYHKPPSMDVLGEIDAIIALAQQLGAMGVRFLQLLGQYADIPPEYQEKFLHVYDSMRGQMKITAYNLIKEKAPGLIEEGDKLVHMIGGGSLVTVYLLVKKPRDGEKEGRKYVVKVANPNSKARILETYDLLMKVLNSLIEKTPHDDPMYEWYLLARDQILPDLKEWTESDIEDTRFFENDKLFKEAFNGWSTPGSPFQMYIPSSYQPNNIYVKVEEYVDGTELTKLQVSEQRDFNEGKVTSEDYKAIIATVAKNYLAQIMHAPLTPEGTVLVHSDAHEGNFKLMSDGRIATLDRNFYIEITKEDREMVEEIIHSELPKEEVLPAFIEYLLKQDCNKGKALDKDELVRIIKEEIKNLPEGNLSIRLVMNLITKLRQHGLRLPLRFTLLLKNLNALDYMAKKAGIQGGLVGAMLFVPNDTVLTKQEEVSPAAAESHQTVALEISGETLTTLREHTLKLSNFIDTHNDQIKKFTSESNLNEVKNVIGEYVTILNSIQEKIVPGQPFSISVQLTPAERSVYDQIMRLIDVVQASGVLNSGNRTGLLKGFQNMKMRMDLRYELEFLNNIQQREAARNLLQKVKEELDRALITHGPSDREAILPVNLHVQNNALARNGGIDFTVNKTPLEIQNAGEGIKFHFDPALLRQLQNDPGFVPVIINISPLNNLRQFLGIEATV